MLYKNMLYKKLYKISEDRRHYFSEHQGTYLIHSLQPKNSFKMYCVLNNKIERNIKAY